MTKIAILPEILTNKIAAGEVVERPASVVKELVENSLDAESTRIIVEVERGGRSLIRISDNGSGMESDDALLAIERYATSKIKNDKDLFSIETLGFRGEALPSIASVSLFTIVTRDAKSDSGIEIIVEGGKIKSVKDIGAPVGTMIEVRNLFFNTPVRKKFLKKITTEMGHIADTLAGAALCRHEVDFTLIHNNRTLKRWPVLSDPFERAADILGSDVRNALLPIKFSTRDMKITGWTSAPHIHRAATRGIFIFVNKRLIKDMTVQRGILEGYKQRFVKGQYPVCAIFLEVPHSMVDVNVHPTKREVRFVDRGAVFRAAAEATFKALKDADIKRWGVAYTDKNLEQNKNKEPGNDGGLIHSGANREPGVPFTEFREKPAAGGHTESKPWSGESAPRKHDNDTPTGLRQSNKPFQHAQPYQPAAKPVEAGGPAPDDYFQAKGSMHAASREAGGDPEPLTIHNERESFEQLRSEKSDKLPFDFEGFSGLRLVGQLLNTYILCEANDGFIVIDQHAAHERIVYENLLKRRSQSSGFAQKLLLPETIEPGFREAELLESMIPELEKVGFEIEPFGGRTFAIKSLPSILAGKDATEIIHEILDSIAESGVANHEDIIDESIKLLACHGAVRAGKKMQQEEMDELLKQLDACENPSNCPHGRPTWIKMDKRALEKSFSRIV